MPIHTIRKLNHIKRCALFPLINPSSVAEHSFHVAVMAKVYSMELSSIPSVEVDASKAVNLALFHDVEEAVTSDIPWTVKNHLRTTTDFDKSINEYVSNHLDSYPRELLDLITEKCDGSVEWLVVKTCDMAELLLYCKEEYDTGNRHLGEMFKNGAEALKELFRLTLERLDLDFIDHHIFFKLDTVKEINKLIAFASKLD